MNPRVAPFTDLYNLDTKMAKKALEDIKQRLEWFKQHIGNLPARSLTASDVESCRKKLSTSITLLSIY